MFHLTFFLAGEAIDKNIKYLVPRTRGRYLEKANYLKYAGNDHFYFSLSGGRQPKIPWKEIVIDLPPRKGSLRTKDPVLMPVEYKGGDKQKPLCGPKNHDIYLNATFHRLVRHVRSKAIVKSKYFYFTLYFYFVLCTLYVAMRWGFRKLWDGDMFLWQVCVPWRR